MRRILFVYLLVMQATFTYGQTADELRELAYAGGFEGIEERLSLAHQRSVDGEISFDDLRRLVDAVATSHPQFFDTVDAWLDAQPESPYANAIRAAQYMNFSWGLRGEDSARRTPQEALRAFSQFQNAAMDHAAFAYERAPDFVYGSDMIMRLQFTTDRFSRFAFLAIVSDVMETTPNYHSLSLAGGFTAPNWGGNGLPDIEIICAENAGKLDDPTFGIDACRLLVMRGWLPIELRSRAWEKLGDQYHPSLDEQRAWYLANSFDPARTDVERKIVEDYLRQRRRNFLNIADDYYWAFLVDRDTDLLLDLARAGRVEAQDTLVHDPYNVEAINILLQEGSFLNVIDSEYDSDGNSTNIANLKARLAVTRPFHPQSWIAAGDAQKYPVENLVANRAMPYYQNALFYADHGLHVLDHVLFYTVDVLQTGYIMKYRDTKISVTPDLPEEHICQFVRVDRIATHQCRSEGQGPQNCPEVRSLIPDYDRLLSEAIATGLCEDVLNGSFGALKYGPIQIMLDELAQPLDWE